MEVIVKKKYKDKDFFIKDTSLVNVYAMVSSNGEWYEPGRMGWFGFSNTTPESVKEFVSFYESYIKDHPEEIMVIVDCHI